MRKKLSVLLAALLALTLCTGLSATALAAQSHPDTSPLITMAAQDGAGGVVLRFSEPMHISTFSVGLNFAKAWTRSWNANGTALTLSGNFTVTASKRTVIVSLMQTEAQKKDIVTPSILELPYAPALKALYEAYKDEVSADYSSSAEIWAAFTGALADAASALDNPSITDVQLDAVYAALQAAIGALAADKAALAAAIARYQGLVSDGSYLKFTVASWQAASDKYSAALAVYSASNNPAEIKAAAAALNAALDACQTAAPLYLKLAAGQSSTVAVRKNFTAQIRIDTNCNTVVYTCSAPTVATVSQTGLVTGKGIGMAIITVRDVNTGYSLNLVVNVTA